tara:strand:+ start:38 stop:289 length:252 start_codon:yes stop_codon:yes gene_type:complete
MTAYWSDTLQRRVTIPDNHLPAEIEAEEDMYWAADDRVKTDPQLAPYADIILDDYADPDHWEWIVNAPISELLDWARYQASMQ